MPRNWTREPTAFHGEGNLKSMFKVPYSILRRPVCVMVVKESAPWEILISAVCWRGFISSSWGSFPRICFSLLLLSSGHHNSWTARNGIILLRSRCFFCGFSLCHSVWADVSLRRLYFFSNADGIGDFFQNTPLAWLPPDSFLFWKLLGWCWALCGDWSLEWRTNLFLFFSPLILFSLYPMLPGWSCQ
jgi:hypothetical protein